MKEYASEERKRFSKGIIIFCCIFLFIGINQMKFSIAYFYLYKVMDLNKMIYVNVSNVSKTMARIESQIEKQRENFKPKEYEIRKRGLATIKNELIDYKKEVRRNKKNMPLMTKVVVLLSLASSFLFLYTSYLMWKLNPKLRLILPWAFLSGFILIFAFFWEVSTTFYVPLLILQKLQRLVNFSSSSGAVSIKTVFDVARLMFWQPKVLGIFLYYFLFMFSTFYYFSLPKVKEQFR